MLSVYSALGLFVGYNKNNRYDERGRLRDGCRRGLRGVGRAAGGGGGVLPVQAYHRRYTIHIPIIHQILLTNTWIHKNTIGKWNLFHHSCFFSSPFRGICARLCEERLCWQRSYGRRWVLRVDTSAILLCDLT